MRQRKHPDYYYEMRDEIIALMDDQAARPFDATNYRVQFRKVAAEHKITATSYLAHFGIIQRMVAEKLPKMKPRQPSFV
ncbi:MAG: hypothetical protein WAT81_00370 [Candidatus Moraniibacteriota bacterium]